eukprot:Gb_22389 [translate_table: standard]
MAEVDEQEKTSDIVVEDQQSLRSLLCNETRDFFIRNNGDKVKVEELEGKIVGLYFSAHWCPPCTAFTPFLSEIYTKLLEKGDFEIILVSSDLDKKSFEEYHQIMPWLALPFSDSQTREKLDEIFDVAGIPTLLLLDKEGRTISTDGVEIIEEHGAQAYPFTAERLDELKAEEEASRAAQTLESLLVSDERDFVIGNGGEKVPVSDLVGKTVCLYFSAHWCPPCRGFTPQLIEIYNELIKKAEALEIVFISNGKTLQTEAVELIRDYSIKAFPFTTERLDELKAEEEARRAAQTLESLLVSDERDFVITHDGGKVPVSELMGKTVGLYFSAHWCPPCRRFTPELIQIYNELKRKGEAFEIVFISSDKNQEAFEHYYKTMPWLALPFGDKGKNDLTRNFRINGIPTLIVIGPDGKTVTADARTIISIHGAKAYPFTDARLVELRKEIEALAEKLPKEVKHSLHEHSLALTQWQVYTCDGCDENGNGWAFCCKQCDFVLDPDCALKDEKSAGSEEKQQEIEDNNEDSKPAGVICKGDVCYRMQPEATLVQSSKVFLTCLAAHGYCGVY